MALGSIHIGEFDKYLTLQTVSETTSTLTNESLLSYTDSVSFFGRFVKKSSNEIYDAAKQVSKSVIVCMVRYDDVYNPTVSITDRMRIKDTENGLTYSILGIEEVDRRNLVMLTLELYV